MAYELGFCVPANFTAFGYRCRFTESDGDVDKYWDCFVSDARKSVQYPV